MPDTPTSPSRLRVADLSPKRATPFDYRPDERECGELAAALALSSLRKARLHGSIRPVGRGDWSLRARVAASVAQPCGITLDPVRMRIDEPVDRVYVADWAEPEGGDEEMPEDDSVEPLRAWIDLSSVFAEALSLALPDFPRADGASFGDLQVAPPGAKPIASEPPRPFAMLAALKKRIETGD